MNAAEILKMLLMVLKDSMSVEGRAVETHEGETGKKLSSGLVMFKVQGKNKIYKIEITEQES